MALSGHGQINPVQVFSGCLSENLLAFSLMIWVHSTLLRTAIVAVFYRLILVDSCIAGTLQCARFSALPMTKSTRYTTPTVTARSIYYFLKHTNLLHLLFKVI
jgi:hypothetical protein